MVAVATAARLIRATPAPGKSESGFEKRSRLSKICVDSNSATTAERPARESVKKENLSWSRPDSVSQ
jgi:hypothetical protein